ncbi:HAD-IC family P-type ATPase [Diaphorobacter sp. J5-51]|uniref:HAD-IC family P-type ATPase n=1 Tax=Diaphorobacter sp. J5-51 TaxID=680496 RepID=UPI00064353EA|nr:HAD-IC family P-type ATPase [Diaphorobacter sp. J5-51]
MEKEEQMDAGLTEEQVHAAREEYGYNEIATKRPSLVRSILGRLWGPIPWLLEFALAMELVIGKVREPVMIALWLVFSAVVGAVQERRSQRVLDLLRSRLSVNASARRNGEWRTIPARELVPGDLIHLGPGDLVAADASVSNGAVEVDQAALTGESATVTRTTGETLYSASTVKSGQATARVTATGTASFFGRTAELVQSKTAGGHLDRLLYAVVRHLVAIDAVLAVALLAFALWRGIDLLTLVPFLLVLIIATVPVTMPAAFTVANAVEARLLARRGVLVTGLSAVQEAATMDVLCIDKTGTLTQNRQVVTAVIPLPEQSGQNEADVLALAAATCNQASQGSVEKAIWEAARQQQAAPLECLQATPFEPATKHSEALVRHGDQTLRVVFGSPAVVQNMAVAFKGLTQLVDALASTGARVMAVAAGTSDTLTIRGLIAMADTLRDDAPALVKSLRALGVRVLMVSGDMEATARTIARKVGLGERFASSVPDAGDPLDYDGFAHCFPQDKFRLIQSLQRTGHVVGMTGDGVNDAPALKQAEVGIAVSDATDVAKACAQVVLTHPGLQDLVAVIESGRRVYRRMLTWTITKIARTIELAALLAIGYIATGFFATSLPLIALLVVLNDVVTITLATDRAWVSPEPEKWSIRQIGRLAAIFAIGWVVLGFVLLWVTKDVLALPVPEIQMAIFVFLIYSAQTTIYLTRVRDRCWSFRPSLYVALATGGNAVIATVVAAFGLIGAALSPAVIAGIFVAVCATTLLFDEIKVRYLNGMNG